MPKKEQKLTNELIGIIIFAFISALFSLAFLEASQPIIQIILGILFLGFIISGVGLIKLNNIVRKSVIGLYCLQIFLLLNLLVQSFPDFEVGIFISSLIRILIGIMIIIYLNKTSVKSLFH